MSHIVKLFRGKMKNLLLAVSVDIAWEWIRWWWWQEREREVKWYTLYIACLAWQRTCHLHTRWGLKEETATVKSGKRIEEESRILPLMTRTHFISRPRVEVRVDICSTLGSSWVRMMTWQSCGPALLLWMRGHNPDYACYSAPEPSAIIRTKSEKKERERRASISVSHGFLFLFVRFHLTSTARLKGCNQMQRPNLKLLPNSIAMQFSTDVDFRIELASFFLRPHQWAHAKLWVSWTSFVVTD